MCENRVLQNEEVQDVPSSSKEPVVDGDNVRENVEQLEQSRETFLDQGHKLHLPHYAPITNRNNVSAYKDLYMALGDKDDPSRAGRFHEFLSGRLHHNLVSRRETFIGSDYTPPAVQATDDVDTDDEYVDHDHLMPEMVETAQ